MDAEREKRIRAAWTASRRNILMVLRDRPTCIVWDGDPQGTRLIYRGEGGPMMQPVATLTFEGKWHREPHSGIRYLSVWCSGLEVMSATPMGRDYDV